MGIFSNRDIYQGYNIYSMKKYVDKKRIIFNIIVIILIILTLVLIIFYIRDTTLRLEKSNLYAKQIVEYKQEQELIKSQKELERQKRIPKLTQQGKENIKNIYNSENKQAFLTFDDGPSSNTNQILEILKENDIKATFFVLGTQVEKMPEITKKAYDEGHYIANHGYTHKYDNIYVSPEQVVNEYNQCNQIVANALQIQEYNSHLFRFPGGSIGGKYSNIKKQAIQLLEQNEILYIDWNALTGDSEKTEPTEDYLMENLQRTTNGKNSIIVLMHDSQAKKVTVDFLPKTIDYLKQQGYEFKNFYSVIN